MTTPFDQLAAEYDVSWTNSRNGRRQRNVVWQEIDELFQPGQRVLDIGCGTGEDALHLATNGVRIDALDASTEMVRISRERGVAARRLRVEDLSDLEGPYDGALSNFGVLNCVDDLPACGTELARLIRAGGKLAICLMPRLCWSEILRFELRRLRPHVVWREMPIHYRSDREVTNAFSQFRLMRKRSIALGDHRLYVFERV
jgi:ubiquinone/menaquinone biosynthesis C-methylase UbiE